VGDPGTLDAIDFYVMTRDLGAPPWSGPWPRWPYRAMRFFLALKREEAKCDAEEREEEMKNAR
jgi:hypothetical protein